MKTAIVTGMTGQDGPYLAKFLLEKGYKVYGLIKRYSNPNFENIKYLNIENDVELITGDITDDGSMYQIINLIKPDEFYNLAAQSFVGFSWNLNKVTTNANALGPLNILNAIHFNSPKTKFYQASTSEMFGNSKVEFQNESTPFTPRSPYGIAKLYGHWITVNFRESYNLYTCSGILFNHESPIRGKEFVTRKITDGVAKIKNKLSDKIILGNINATRDWGFAGDYVKAMWLMLQQNIADDYVISTGIKKSVKDVLDIAFNEIGINDWTPYVQINSAHKRPAELNALLGDSSKVKNNLGWEPSMKFEELIKFMVKEDLKRYENRR